MAENYFSINNVNDKIIDYHLNKIWKKTLVNLPNLFMELLGFRK